MSRAELIQLSVSLVKTYGFTREALSRSVLALPPAQTHREPLGDNAIDALFGHGDQARRALINAWLDEGIKHMKPRPLSNNIGDILHSRLEYNEPVLQYLPEVDATALEFSLSNLFLSGFRGSFYRKLVIASC